MKKDFVYLSKAESYIEQFGNKCLRAQEVAYAIGIHPSDLGRLFRRIKGITLKKYLDQKLKTEVIRLLIESDSMGYEISYQIGFSSEQSFYRWIKRVFGISFKELADLKKEPVPEVI